MRGLLLAALIGAAAAAPAAAQQLFNRADIEYLVGKKDQNNVVVQEGAEGKIQIFYHYFKRDRDPKLHVPVWLDKNLNAMLSHAVWNDPDDGLLNEAQLWQAPASVLYEFFELVRQSFPPDDGGKLVSPGALIREYEDNRIRFQMSCDRLIRARLGNSLAGRGRAVLANFDLINKQMDSVMDGLINGNTQRYKAAVIGIGALSEAAYQVLQENPRGWAPPPGPNNNLTSAAVLFFCLGVAAMFASGFSVGLEYEDDILGMVERYKAKAKEWAHEYERQFVVIKIHYLVGGPIAAGFLIGALTFNPFGFLIFLGFGVYAGLILPGWLLRIIRQRRGAGCEAQLMDSMVLMSNGLKSGIDLIGCIAMVQKDMQPPISEEFGLCLKNYHLGMSLDKALEGIEERVQSRLLSYMIKAVVIQRSVGGNLTKIFDRIVENIREESKLVEKTAAMTAQQRIQSIVVGMMPWVMLLIMFAFQPKSMTEYYFSPLGVFTLLFCTVWISIGMKIVNKLGDIDV
jgi:tight adherence protein B